MHQLRSIAFRFSFFVVFAVSALNGVTGHALGLKRSAKATEVVVHIAIIDHMAFSTAAYDEVNDFIRENMPDKLLISHVVEASIVRNNREHIRSQLWNSIIDADMPENGLITHLIVDTHGTTLSVDTKDDTTRLAQLGQFSDKAIDQDLRTILAPLASRLSPSLVIVLNSCTTLCGTTEAAAARASTLLRELGAPNGQIYGSTTPEVERPGALLGRNRWLQYLSDVGQLKLFMSLGAALGVPISVLTQVSAGVTDLPTLMVHASLSAVAATGGLLAITTAMKAFMARFAGLNVGRVMTFRNGRLLADHLVDKFDARMEIYGLKKSSADLTVGANACHELF